MNRDVQFFSPVCLDEALGLLAEYGDKVTVLAGGTDVVPKINYFTLQPEAILYIAGLGLDYIKEEDDAIVLGACATLAQILDSALLAEKIPALVQAARSSSSTAIHTTATIGGNIMNLSPAGDMIPTLFVMGAELVLASVDGERSVKIGDFFTGYKQCVLAANELVKEIRIPKAAGGSAYIKLGKRKAQTLSVVSCAARVAVEDGVVKEVGLALGSMAPTVIDISDDAACMIGKPFSGELVAQAAEAAIAKTEPISDTRATAWYRKTAGVSVVKRAIYAAAGVEYAD